MDGKPNIWLYDPCNLIPNYTYALAQSLSSSASISLIAKEYDYCSDLHLPRSINRINWPSRLSRLLKSRKFGLLSRLAKLFEYPFGVLKLSILMLMSPPHVFHIQWDRLPALDLLLVVIARMRGVHSFFTVHDIEPLYARKGKSLARSMLLQLVDGVLVHSHENSRRLRTIYPGLESDKIEVIPFGASISDAPMSQHAARQCLGIEEDAFVCGFVGNIKEYKGLDDLLLAALPLLESQKSFNLLVAGRCETKEMILRLNQLASEYSNFRFFDGYIPEAQIEFMFRACDLIALPYRRVSQSGVVFQSFGFGRAVMATRVGGLTEVVEDRLTGVLVEAGNIEEMRQIMTDYRANRQKLEQMGQTARSRLASKNSWEASAMAHMRIYRNGALALKELICES